MKETARRKILLEIDRQYNQKDIESILADYKEINVFFGDCIDELHLAAVPITFWQEYLETHLFKFNLLNSSLIREFEGVEIPISKNLNHQKMYDISALYLMGRAQLETFLMIQYLYLNVKSDDHGIFRYFLYEYGGLCIRQDYPATLKENKAKKAIEKTRIEELKKILQSNKYFKSLLPKIQKKILNSKKPKEFGWSDIIEETGLDEVHHMNWRFYSNYAHSELIEAIQLKELFLNSNNIQSTCHHILTLVMMFQPMLIMNLVKKYPAIERLYNTRTLELKTKIEIWNIFGLKHELPAPQDL